MAARTLEKQTLEKNLEVSSKEAKGESSAFIQASSSSLWRIYLHNVTSADRFDQMKKVLKEEKETEERLRK